MSAGAARWAALISAAERDNSGTHLVVLLPDSGERYLSTQLSDMEE
jgi:cysteine synthase A